MTHLTFHPVLRLSAQWWWRPLKKRVPGATSSEGKRKHEARKSEGKARGDASAGFRFFRLRPIQAKGRRGRRRPEKIGRRGSNEKSRTQNEPKPSGSGIEIERTRTRARAMAFLKHGDEAREDGAPNADPAHPTAVECSTLVFKKESTMLLNPFFGRFGGESLVFETFAQNVSHAF